MSPNPTSSATSVIGLVSSAQRRDARRDPQFLSVTLFNPAEDEREFVSYRDMGIAWVVVMLLSEEPDDTAGPGPLDRADPPHRALSAGNPAQGVSR
jgi:hypothetical protein